MRLSSRSCIAELLRHVGEDPEVVVDDHLAGDADDAAIEVAMRYFSRPSPKVVDWYSPCSLIFFNITDLADLDAVHVTEVECCAFEKALKVCG